jgi:hypothetical protein
MFDEQPDGDPHGECAAEIHRLERELSEARRLLAEAADQVPVGYQQMVNGKWEHCTAFVALGFRDTLAPGFRAVYAGPVTAGVAEGHAPQPDHWPFADAADADDAHGVPVTGSATWAPESGPNGKRSPQKAQVDATLGTHGVAEVHAPDVAGERFLKAERLVEALCDASTYPEQNSARAALTAHLREWANAGVATGHGGQR